MGRIDSEHMQQGDRLRPALAMCWEHLLFMHWPVEPEAVQRALPPGLTVDTFDGRAWVGVVPFIMSGVRPRWLPALPWLSRFCELNVRTYVRSARDEAGVYFFSLDCERLLAVEVARAGWRLPYFRARMSVGLGSDGSVHYTSVRRDRRGPRAVFGGRYWPTGPANPSAPGSLPWFLTERYALFTAGRGEKILRGPIMHRRWPLQPAACAVAMLDMTRGLGFDLPADGDGAMLHYARRLDVWAAATTPVD